MFLRFAQKLSHSRNVCTNVSFKRARLRRRRRLSCAAGATCIAVHVRPSFDRMEMLLLVWWCGSFGNPTNSLVLHVQQLTEPSPLCPLETSGRVAIREPIKSLVVTTKTILKPWMWCRDAPRWL